MSKFRGTREETGLGDLLEGGSWIRERFILYLILILILIPDLSFARIPPLLSHGLFIYLCRVLLCLRLERVHSSPFLPSPPSIPAVGSIANSLLIFFFFVKKKFKRKKFRFDTWTCWFEKDLIESFVRLVAFCFTHSGVECEFWTFEFVYNLIRRILRIKLKLKFWEFIRELTIFLPLPVRLQ